MIPPRYSPPILCLGYAEKQRNRECIRNYKGKSSRVEIWMMIFSLAKTTENLL